MCVGVLECGAITESVQAMTKQQGSAPARGTRLPQGAQTHVQATRIRQGIYLLASTVWDHRCVQQSWRQAAAIKTYVGMCTSNDQPSPNLDRFWSQNLCEKIKTSARRPTSYYAPPFHKRKPPPIKLRSPCPHLPAPGLLHVKNNAAQARQAPPPKGTDSLLVANQGGHHHIWSVSSWETGSNKQGEELKTHHHSAPGTGLDPSVDKPGALSR